MPDLQGTPAPSPVAAKPKSRTTVVLIALAVVALGAGGIYFWLQADSPAKPAESAGGSHATLVLDTFVVNVSGSEQRAYLRVGITLALSRPLPRNKEEVPVALLRDTVLSVLSTVRAEQLVQAEGKRQLKGELLQALQERTPQLGIEDVYFTEFLVQM
jgi:flagellar basal body-associated protein FliL